MSESCIDDEIPQCKCVNGPIKGDIALHKKNSYNKNIDEGSNNLPATLINSCKPTTSENVIRTTQTPNNNDVINDDLAPPTRKKTFPTNTSQFKLGSIEIKFNKRKNSSPITRELDIPVSKKAVQGFSSKPSGVDFGVVIDKPSKTMKNGGKVLRLFGGIQQYLGL